MEDGCDTWCCSSHLATMKEKLKRIMNCKPGPTSCYLFLLCKKNILLFKSLKSVCLIFATEIFLTGAMDKSDSFVAINKILKIIESGIGLCLYLFYSLSFQLSILSNFGEHEEDTVLLPRGSLQLNRA